ncbi:MAG: hypothetical protein ACLSEY_01775 [Enterocloster sp.]
MIHAKKKSSFTYSIFFTLHLFGFINTNNIRVKLFLIVTIYIPLLNEKFNELDELKEGR